MLAAHCNESDLIVQSDATFTCSNWVFVPQSGWDSMTNQEFHDLLSAVSGVGAVLFLIWLITWALRRF